MRKLYKWTKKEKDWVKKYTDALKKKFNLQGWSFYYDFKDGYAEAINGEIIDAHTAITFNYEKLIIVLESPMLKDIRDGKLSDVKSSLRHEVTHALVEELWELAMNRHSTEDQIKDAAERLTQRISMLIDAPR